MCGMDEHTERLTRIEEALGFNDRAVEELNGALREAFARIESLERQVRALGERVASVEEGGEEEEDVGENGSV